MSTPPPSSRRLRPGLVATVAVLTTIAAVTGLVRLINRDFRHQSHLVNVSLQSLVGREPMIRPRKVRLLPSPNRAVRPPRSVVTERSGTCTRPREAPVAGSTSSSLACSSRLR